MVIASIYGTSFIVLGTLLAFWSLWWIIQAARTNPAEREAEDEARARVARGEGWGDDFESAAPKPFSDSEIDELSTALAPDTPESAGIDARPKPAEPKGRFNRR